MVAVRKRITLLQNTSLSRRHCSYQISFLCSAGKQLIFSRYIVALICSRPLLSSFNDFSWRASNSLKEALS